MWTESCSMSYFHSTNITNLDRLIYSPIHNHFSVSVRSNVFVLAVSEKDLGIQKYLNVFMLSTYNHHYQSWVFRAFWRRANIQAVSSRNSLQWPTYIMYLLIKRRKLFIQNVLRFRILRHQNLADLISLTWYDSQSKKASLYNYLKIFFHSQAPHRIICSVEAIPQRILKSIPQFYVFL